MDIFRVVVIFIHLVFFGFAITKLYRSDFALLFNRPHVKELRSMESYMLVCLIGLWLTGLMLVFIDTGFNVQRIAESKKLITKLVCVMVLTLNAFLIHLVAFKRITKRVLSRTDVLILGTAGAISTTSWSFAAFLGVAKPLVNYLSLTDFLSLYGIMLTGSIFVATLAMPLIIRNWGAQMREDSNSGFYTQEHLTMGPVTQKF